MKITLFPSSQLQGDATPFIPGDKSISHRAALFAAIAEGESKIQNFQVSGVTKPMLNSLTSMNIEWCLNENFLVVKSKGINQWQKPLSPIHCGNSATTLRLLAGALSASGISATLDGSQGLCRRPMRRIIDPLQQMGVKISATPEGTAPLLIKCNDKKTHLAPLDHKMSVASAQVKSCLLLAALAASGKSRIVEPGPSRDHTERLLSSMGVKISTAEHEQGFEITLFPPDLNNLKPLVLTIPADPSAAAFLLVASIITKNSKITMSNVCLNPTRTGLLDVLKQMGAKIVIDNERQMGGEPVGELTVFSSELQGIEISGETVVRMIDEFPIFAVAAACAKGTTLVRDAAELRVKESDRIGMLVKELIKIGVNITETQDGFSISGGKITGGNVDSYGDHRLAMSLAVAGLAALSPVSIQGAECIAESFPLFLNSLEFLGAKLEIEDE